MVYLQCSVSFAGLGAGLCSSVCVCVCVCVVVCDGPAREEPNLSYLARDPLFWLDIMYELVNVNLNFLFFSSGTPGLHFSLQVS